MIKSQVFFKLVIKKVKIFLVSSLSDFTLVKNKKKIKSKKVIFFDFFAYKLKKINQKTNTKRSPSNNKLKLGWKIAVMKRN